MAQLLITLEEVTNIAPRVGTHYEYPDNTYTEEFEAFMNIMEQRRTGWDGSHVGMADLFLLNDQRLVRECMPYFRDPNISDIYEDEQETWRKVYEYIRHFYPEQVEEYANTESGILAVSSDIDSGALALDEFVSGDPVQRTLEMAWLISRFDGLDEDETQRMIRMAIAYWPEVHRLRLLPPHLPNVVVETSFYDCMITADENTVFAGCRFINTKVHGEPKLRGCYFTKRTTNVPRTEVTEEEVIDA
jgi:hypothetical protein